MCMMRQLLIVYKGIQLINSLIKETNLQYDVIKFLQIQNFGNIGFKFGKVGKGWWQGFLKRNGEKIVTKMGKKFVSDRLD